MRFREYEKSEEGERGCCYRGNKTGLKPVSCTTQHLFNLKNQQKIIQLKKQDGFTTELFNAKTKNDFDQYVHD